MDKFELIYLETEGRIIVFAGVMEKELLNFFVEGFGFGDKLFFLLKGFFESGVFLQVFKVVDFKLELFDDFI